MSAAPMPLSLPRDIFATVSPAPYLLANLERTSLRANGRKPSEFRQPDINTNSLAHCFGSAVTSVGDTAVVCGVRGEILLASDVANPPQIPAGVLGAEGGAQADDAYYEIPALNLLVPNIELATGCSPANIPGNAPSTLAQSLSQRLLSLLHSTRLVDVNDVRILYQPPHTIEDDKIPDAPPALEVKAYWTLYIDILFISLDGNPFDAAWGAMLAALKNTKLPRAWWDADAEMILCSYAAAEARNLSLQGLPIPASFAIFDTRRHKGMGEGQREWLLVDPDDFEEGLCEETVCVTLDASKASETKICRIEKSGGTIVDIENMKLLIRLAEQRWRDWANVVGASGG